MAVAKRDAADRLHSAAIHLLRVLKKADSVTALTPARLSALSVLVFGGDHSLTELARAEGVTSPTMTRLVQGLEADGLVERAKDDADGRATVLRASRRARAMLQTARQRRLDVFEELLSRATPDEVMTLDRSARIIERLVSNASPA